VASKIVVAGGCKKLGLCKVGDWVIGCDAVCLASLAIFQRQKIAYNVSILELHSAFHPKLA
jgi:hypothetical protein